MVISNAAGELLFLLSILNVSAGNIDVHSNCIGTNPLLSSTTRDVPKNY